MTDVDGSAPIDVAPVHGLAWYLVRVSGLFLAVLVPLHFAVVVVDDDVGRTTIATVTERFADPRWQAIELVTIVLALVHAFLALRRMVLDRSWPAGRGEGVVVVLGVAFVFVALAAAWAMLSLS